MPYSPSTGKLYGIAMPPRDPNGRSSLCRSSCTMCKEISKVSLTGLGGANPVASRVT